MNIYDIAKECGVSIATVSRVLNNNPKVRPETRDKILAVMKEQNYTPSSMARGLGTGYTRIAGVVCTDLRNPSLCTAVGAVEEVLRQQGLSCLIRATDGTPADKQKALGELANQGVDGILLLGDFGEEDEAAIYTAAQRAPVVAAGNNLNIPGVYCVQCDEQQAVASLVGDLFGRQRRNILLLHSGDISCIGDIVAGYRMGYEKAGLTADDAHIIRIDPTPEAVNICIKHLLMQRVNFDAVIGTEDVLAVSAQKALQRIGLSMPVVGCGNSLLAQCATPELSSIDTQTRLVAATAANLLCRRLQGEDIPPYTILPATLVERDTFRRN